VSISPNGMRTEAGIPFLETPGIIFSPLWYPVGTNWVLGIVGILFWNQWESFMPCKVLRGKLYQIWALAWLRHTGPLIPVKIGPWGFTLYFEMPHKELRKTYAE
jgi:hypothetical protein